MMKSNLYHLDIFSQLFSPPHIFIYNFLSIILCHIFVQLVLIQLTISFVCSIVECNYFFGFGLLSCLVLLLCLFLSSVVLSEFVNMISRLVDRPVELSTVATVLYSLYNYYHHDYNQCTVH